MKNIIWTPKDLLEWINDKDRIKKSYQQPLSGLVLSGLPRDRYLTSPPIENILVIPETELICSEVSQVRGHLQSVLLSFPSGCMGLVWVSVILFYRNGRDEKLILTPRLGDNSHSITPIDEGILQGDEVRVVIFNADTVHSHTIGIRVDVDIEEEI